MRIAKIYFSAWMVILAFINQSKAQNSLNEKTGLWEQVASWTGGIMPGGIASGTITATSNTVVIRGTTMTMYNLSLVLSNVSINAGDTLIILGNLNVTSSSLTNNGVMIVYGDMSNLLSNNTISGSGKLVVTGDYNNAAGANNFAGPSYIFGNTNGFLFSPSVEDQSDLISDDPTLNNYVNTMYGVLPIELLSFTAVSNQDEVVLSWTTASEENNDYFILEKSLDGITFQSIETIEGAGTSNSIREYSYIDQQPIMGRSYYRISQVDFAGITTSLNIIKLEYSDNDQIKFYPNPVADYIYSNIDLSKFSIAIQDTQGFYQTGTSTLLNGIPAIDITQLDKGVYFLRLIDQKDQFTKSFRFIKL